MAADLIEFKPGIGSLKLNVVELLRRWRRKPDPATQMGQRFLDLFRAHGVQPVQIQRLLPQVTPDRVTSPEALLPLLTNETLTQAADLFGIQREWLEGTTDRIYPSLTCYKQPELFFQDLAAIRASRGTDRVQVIYSHRGLGGKDLPRQLALILAEETGQVGDETICRYRVYTESWFWDHPPCRLQLKAMARLVFLTRHIVVPMVAAPDEVVTAVTEGKRFVHDLLRYSASSQLNLEDFALAEGTDISQGQSGVARDTHELPLVLHYIAHHKLEAAARPPA
jgi:hypothetical protein